MPSCNEHASTDVHLITTASLIRCVERSQSDHLLAAFTFLIPSSLVKGIRSDVQTTEFPYNGLLWQARIVRNELHIDAQLELISPLNCSSGVSESDSLDFDKNPSNMTDMKVKKMSNFLFSVDLKFTVLNRLHFSKNQSFSATEAMFTPRCRNYSSKSLIETSYLSEGQFLFDDGSFLLEIEFINSCLTITLHLSTKADLLSLTYGSERSSSFANDESGTHQVIKFTTRTQNVGPKSWRLCIFVPSSRFTSNQWPPERIGMYCYYSKECKHKKGEKSYADADILTIIFHYNVMPNMDTQHARFRIESDMRKSTTVYMAPDPAAALVSNLQKQIQSHLASSSMISPFRPRLKIPLRRLLFKQSTPSALTCVDENTQLFFSPLVDVEGFPWNLYVHFDNEDLLADDTKKDHSDSIIRACLQTPEPKNALSRLSENTVRVVGWSLDFSSPVHNRQFNAGESCQSFATRFQQLHGSLVTGREEDTLKDGFSLGETFSPSHFQWPIETNSSPQSERNISGKTISHMRNQILSGSKLALAVEWTYSRLLRFENFGLADAVNLTHMYQMRRELDVLRSENLALKRQLIGFQDKPLESPSAAKF